MRCASLLVTFVGIFALATVTMALDASDAHADPTATSWWTDFQLDTTLLRPTQLDFDTAHFGSRALQGRLPKTGSTVLLGASWDFGLIVDHHWLVPVFGLGAAFAVGSYAEQMTSIDGSLVHQRPWTTSQTDITIGGLGYRANARRWSLSATLLPGFAFFSGGADATYGSDTYELDPSRTLFFLRAELAACRRVDPMERLCAVVSPNVYQDGFFQGGSLSFRYEVGR